MVQPGAIVTVWTPARTVEVHLSDNPEDSTWFSLGVFNVEFTGKTFMRWELRKN